MHVDLLTDPAFLLAVAAWLVVLVGALALCAAAARGDRQVDRARADVAERASFRTWDATADLADVIELPKREPAQVLPFPRQIGGFRK